MINYYIYPIWIEEKILFSQGRSVLIWFSSFQLCFFSFMPKTYRVFQSWSVRGQWVSWFQLSFSSLGRDHSFFDPFLIWICCFFQVILGSWFPWSTLYFIRFNLMLFWVVISMKGYLYQFFEFILQYFMFFFLDFPLMQLDFIWIRKKRYWGHTFQISLWFSWLIRFSS